MIRWIAILGASVLALLLTFGLGLLVGRYWEGSAARDAGGRESAPHDVAGAPARKAASAKRSAPAEGEGDRPRETSEKLTFYQTLTAPLGPSHARPGAEARPRPPAAPAAPGGEPSRALASAPSPTTGQATGQSTGRSTGQSTGQSTGWSVQVGAFQNRPQADTLQHELRRAGFEAYLTTLGTPDGQTRFRVRVGTFPDRVLAQRTADRLRTERSLPSYVTPN